jgi:hypothetical protein
MADFTDGLLQTRGFVVQVSHLSVGGLCAECRGAGASGAVSPRRGAHPGH